MHFFLVTHVLNNMMIIFLKLKDFFFILEYVLVLLKKTTIFI